MASQTLKLRWRSTLSEVVDKCAANYAGVAAAGSCPVIRWRISSNSLIPLLLQFGEKRTKCDAWWICSLRALFDNNNNNNNNKDICNALNSPKPQMRSQ